MSSVFVTYHGFVSIKELRETKGGKSVINFSVLHSKDAWREGEEDYAEWYNCSAWGNQAEFLDRNRQKIQGVVVTGEQIIQRYKNKEGQETVNIGIPRPVNIDIIWKGKNKDGEQHQEHNHDEGFAPPPNLNNKNEDSDSFFG